MADVEFRRRAQGTNGTYISNLIAMVATRLELRLEFIGQKFILRLDSEAACVELTEGASNNSAAQFNS